jgi:predicted nucleotidyltransferase
MDLLAAFLASNVEYLVVGGWAVAFHSEPRFTRDLDLLIGDDSDANLQRVAEALAVFGAPSHIVEQARSLAANQFLFFGSPPVRVDLLRQIPGVEFRSAFSRRIEADWNGCKVCIISREDLIAAKQASRRERDLNDLRIIERTRR